MRIGIAERASLFVLDGQPCAFSEAEQKVYQLNPAAAAILADLDRPRAIDEVRSALAPVLAGGIGEFDNLMVQWSDAGLIELSHAFGCPASPSVLTAALPLPSRTLALVTDGSGRDWFGAYDHLPRCDEPKDGAVALTSGDLGLIRVSDGPSRVVPRDLLAATFRYSLMEFVLTRRSETVLHCACLVAGDEAVLLLGQPGAGKSTLAMFASEIGFGLAGDDVGLIVPRSCSIMPIALPLTLKRGSWERLGETTFREFRAEPVMRQDGVEVIYLPLPQAPPAAPLKIRGLVKLDRHENEAARLDEWSKTDCLRYLCSEAKSPSGLAGVDDIEGMVAILDRAATLTLTYADAREAAALLGRRFG